MHIKPPIPAQGEQTIIPAIPTRLLPAVGRSPRTPGSQTEDDSLPTPESPLVEMSPRKSSRLKKSPEPTDEIKIDVCDGSPTDSPESTAGSSPPMSPGMLPGTSYTRVRSPRKRPTQRRSPPRPVRGRQSLRQSTAGQTLPQLDTDPSLRPRYDHTSTLQKLLWSMTGLGYSLVYAQSAQEFDSENHWYGLPVVAAVISNATYVLALKELMSFYWRDAWHHKRLKLITAAIFSSSAFFVSDTIINGFKKPILPRIVFWILFLPIRLALHFTWLFKLPSDQLTRDNFCSMRAIKVAIITTAATIMNSCWLIDALKRLSAWNEQEALTKNIVKSPWAFILSLMITAPMIVLTTKSLINITSTIYKSLTTTNTQSQPLKPAKVIAYAAALAISVLSGAVSYEITKRQTPEKFLQVSTAIGGTMCNLFYLLMLVSQIFTPTEKKQTPMNTKRRYSDEMDPRTIAQLNEEHPQDSAGTALLEPGQHGFHI